MKKFLSLVLALIMTMSLVTISAGATEYRDLTDKDEIQYEEAVAVLNRIGVITGYEDGSFRPETELTRGAAAKIIVSLMIGPEAASALPNNASPYPDVPAGHTFAGVIGYCKTAGYISGYGDGTFKPANPLTGYAFAKMLLGAIGYKANIEGFVDTGWTMNVARIGNVAGLFDRLNFDGAKAVTRDEACQLALNTLKATMVDYGNSNTVVSSNGQVLTVQGSKAQYVTSNNRDINANINRRVISAQNNEMTLEFGEEHFKDLRLEHDRYDPAYDIYGHPSNEWSYKKVTIGTFKLPADFTFTKQMAHIEDTPATKEKALGLRGYDTYSTDHRGGYVNWSTAASNAYGTSPFADATQIHINGWNARVLNADLYKQTTAPKGESPKKGDWYTYDAGSITATTKDLAPSLSEICDLTDNGVTVEVYVCPVDADFITDVVVTRTQLMKVDRIASDYVELETVDSDSKDPRKAGKLEDIAGYNDYSLFDEVASVKDNNYDAYNVLKDLKAGDEVAIIPYTTDDGKTWEVGVAYVPETVSGALTNVDIYNTRSKPEGNAIAITVGGTTYPIAQWNKDMREIDGYKIRSSKKDVTLLLDKDGNALLAKDVGSSNNWIIVGDYYQAAGANSRVSWFVHGWTIKGDEVDLELGTIRGAAEKYAPGELVKYQVAEEGNGEYELVKPMFSTDAASNANYPNGRRVLKNGGVSSWVEPLGGKDNGEQTGEGIYNVAQYALQGGSTKKYNISSKNTLLPLEFYDTIPSRRTEGELKAAGEHKKYSDASDLVSVASAGDIAATDTTEFYGKWEGSTANYNTWTYRPATYDGVKFIFVGFDSTNGEVDTINVLDGVQNVDYDELIQINRWWKNVGTNNEEFVASPAEAYVDKNGKVKAVVIKSDSAEANLKDLMIITDNRGANTSTKGGAEAPTSGTYYTRQYVSGEDGFKEEKTGYFDRMLSVGTVITGRLDSNNVFKTRTFHANEYTNRNPDGFYAKGILPLVTNENKKSDYAFYVGPENGGGVAEFLGTGVKGNGKNLVKPATVDADGAKILTSLDVMGIDTPVKKEGLIKVDSTTQFLDLRDGRPGDIDELGDLFDKDKCDWTKVELKILVNGNENSDGFRHAYAIMVLNAKPVADDASAAGVTITARVDGKSTLKDSVAANDGKTKDTAWTWTVAPGAEVALTARVTATGTAQNPKWTDVTTSDETVVSDDYTVEVVAGEDGTTQILKFTVDNYDPTHANEIRATATYYVKVVSKADASADATFKGTISTHYGKVDIDWTGEVLGNKTRLVLTLKSWPTFASTDTGTKFSGVVDLARNGIAFQEELTHVTADGTLAGDVVAPTTSGKSPVTFTRTSSGTWNTVILEYNGVMSKADSLVEGKNLSNEFDKGFSFIASKVKGEIKTDSASKIADLAPYFTIADIATEHNTSGAGQDLAFTPKTTISVGDITVSKIEGAIYGATTALTAANTTGFALDAAGAVKATNGTGTQQCVGADGTQAVVVTLSSPVKTSLDTLYSFTGVTAQAITGAGIDTGTTITITPDKASAKDGTNFWKVSLSNAVKSAGKPVTVTVTKDTYSFDVTFSSVYAGTANIDSASFTVDKSIDLTGATFTTAVGAGNAITAKEAKYVPAGAAVATSGDAITIEFNAEGNIATFTAPTPAQGTSTETNVMAVSSSSKSGKFITIVPGTNVAKDGNTLTFAAGTVVDDKGYSNANAIEITLQGLDAGNLNGSVGQLVSKTGATA